MKTILAKYSPSKYAIACLLIYTGILSLVVFWHTTNMILGIWAILAAVGWLVWWIERFVISDEPEAEAGGAATAIVPSASAQSPSQPVVPPVTAPQANSGGPSVREKTSKTTSAPVPAIPLTEQMRSALVEAEQAVSLSIKTFEQITLDAREMAQCAREMMGWASETSPLAQSALSHLSEKSDHISNSAEAIAAAFHSHDLLRQRLEQIAADLDTQ